MNKYRIKEHQGEFTIQVLYIETSKKFNWRKLKLQTKKEPKWYASDVFGRPAIFSMTREPFLLPSYSSLEKAQKVIENLKSKPKYHYHD